MSAQENIVFFNGELKPESEVGISIRDRGYLYGDAVFDATRTFNGAPFKLREHIHRLYDSLRYLRIDSGMEMSEMERWSMEVVDHNHPLLPPNQDLWVMQRISRGVETTEPDQRAGPTILIETHAIPFARRASLYRDGVRVVTPSVPRIPPRFLSPRAKTHNYLNLILGDLEAQATEPDNDRNWKPEVAVLASATFNGNLVTVRNIRNFDYITENEFMLRYYDKTFDLNKLESVDFIVSYWDDLKAIAHTMLSFGFAGEDYLAVSIEVRGEKGEGYSGLKGLFKQYEIIYVVGDERDLVRLRTNYRGEDTYLYPTTLRPEETRALFVDILRQVGKLAEEPAFYRTLGRNCTTSLISHINAIPGQKVAFSRKLLMNGYSDQLAYERGRIRSNLPFNETKRLHFISPIAKKYNDDPEFSHKIRAELRKRGSSM